MAYNSYVNESFHCLNFRSIFTRKFEKKRIAFYCVSIKTIKPLSVAVQTVHFVDSRVINQIHYFFVVVMLLFTLLVSNH